MTATIQIKGIKEGLLITLRDEEWGESQKALISHLDQQADFLKGARLALDVGNQIIKAAEMGLLRDQISERGLTLWCVVSDSPRTQETAQTLGLATRISRPAPERTVSRMDTTLSGDAAVLVRRTLRSGFSMEQSGHVVIIGDVNPGAEIIAGGDVVVWGRLRGMVHAGANGNREAVVCALDLSPTQLRIAGQIFIPPRKKGKPLPELARWIEGQIQVETWNPKGK
jgi:septum site-determining protein MinC